MVLEIAVGTWSGSMALLADGWHMGTHSAAFLIAIFTYSYTKKHAKDRSFSFGTGKVNHLGGFASAVALAIIALLMAIESVQRLLDPQMIRFNEAIAIAFLGLIVNIISVWVLHDDHDHHGHDHNLKAAYFHVLADTLTSVLAIAALFAGKLVGLIWMDAVVGIVGAAVIGKWAVGLIKSSSQVLLDKNVHADKFSRIAEEIKTMNEAVVTDLHIWRVGMHHEAAIVSISARSPRSPDDYKRRVASCLPGLAHITVEVNEQ
jgi:cation diffusion facilitator family transporter